MSIYTYGVCIYMFKSLTPLLATQKHPPFAAMLVELCVLVQLSVPTAA